ncbi:formylglycine-generating enzyme family protein [Gemmobacter fulvus]|nr:formylglycine-generating enzyme family protein [Gemmobacter fulvus]
MIVTPPGEFMMGAIPGESRNPFDFYGVDASMRRREPEEMNIIPSEHPRHRVFMDIPYAMSRNEITRAEWMACVDAKGCSYIPDHRVLTFEGYLELGPQHPVVNVSWRDAQTYVTWLNSLIGEPVYRLPTEAEWEYAARAGTTTSFAQGETLSQKQANFSRRATENILDLKMPELRDPLGPVPVDELDAANAWGFRHMSGNVFELTLSCWSETHLGLPSASAYLKHAEGSRACSIRVAKGGAFTMAMDSLRLAQRIRPKENARNSDTGLRIIRTLHRVGEED